MVILTVGLRVVAFAVAGLPVAMAGLWAGHRAHVRVRPALMARLIGSALFLTGAALLVRTF